MLAHDTDDSSVVRAACHRRGRDRPLSGIGGRADPPVRPLDLPRCPDLGEVGLPLRALGQAGAQALAEEMRAAPPRTIGIGHGRTLGAVVGALPRGTTRQVRFVSLLGGLTRSFAANPDDVMHRLAQRTGAEAYVLPVPFFANSAADRDVLLGQRGIEDVVRMGLAADVMIAGIGTVQPDAQIIASRLVEREEVSAVMDRDGRAYCWATSSTRPARWSGRACRSGRWPPTPPACAPVVSSPSPGATPRWRRCARCCTAVW